MTEAGVYEERIYVIDENFQPVTILVGSSAEAYEEILWTVDEQGEKLRIVYEDGSAKNYALEELVDK